MFEDRGHSSGQAASASSNQAAAAAEPPPLPPSPYYKDAKGYVFVRELHGKQDVCVGTSDQKRNKPWVIVIATKVALLNSEPTPPGTACR